MNINNLKALALCQAPFFLWAASGALAETASHDAKPEFHLGGSIQLDYGADTDEPSPDEFSLRRLRVNVKGDIPNAAEFKVVIDIDEDADISFTDVYVKRRLNDAGDTIIVGQHRTANSLDEQTSSKNISILERPAFTDAFSLGRRLGVSAVHSRDSYSVSVGGFARDIDGEDVRQGKAFAGRIVYHPVLDDETRLHIGASARYRALSDDDAPIEYNQRAFSRMTNIAAEASIQARSDIFWGGEISFVRNNFWATSEYSALIAKPGAAQPDADSELLHGGYVEAGVIIGGRRSYDKGRFHKPVIHRPVTKGGPGAFAFAARFDTLDLGENETRRSDYNAIILGADWLPFDNMRFGANVFSATADAAVPDGVSAFEASDRVKGVLLRGQLAF